MADLGALRLQEMLKAAYAQPAADAHAPVDAKDDAEVNALLSRRIVLGNRALYGQAIAATIALNILALAVPLFTMNVYDRVLPNNAQTTLIALAAGSAIAALFEIALKTLRASLIDVASRRADLVLSMRVFSRVLGAKLAPRAQSVGVQANTLREIETIRDFNTSVTLTALGDLPFGLLFLTMIAIIGGPLVIVPLIVIPIVLALVIVLQIPLLRMHDISFRHMAQKSAVLVETLTGLETLKGIGAEGWAASKWEKAVADQLRMSTAMRFLAGLGMNVVALGTSVATIAMIVLGVTLVGDRVITAGAVMGAMMLLGRAMGPVAQVAALLGKLHSVKLSKQALAGVMLAPQERAAHAIMLAPPTLKGGIAFEDVTFGYDPGSAPALQSVSFNIKPGERVGILGTIGSGKSTLLKLATKLHEPQTGRVLIDGLGLAGLDPAVLRARLGLLGQNSILFKGTVRENMQMHRPGASDADLIDAAEAAGAFAWIGRLPKGFDTPLGERGAGLSGGQQRSLALARALLGSPRMLLLDEPTSEMDGRSEQLVIERLSAALGDRTLLLVTHKYPMLALIDRLIVIDGGRIHHDGPKAAVLAALAGRSEKANAVPRKAGAAA